MRCAKWSKSQIRRRGRERGIDLPTSFAIVALRWGTASHVPLASHRQFAGFGFSLLYRFCRFGSAAKDRIMGKEGFVRCISRRAGSRQRPEGSPRGADATPLAGYRLSDRLVDRHTQDEKHSTNGQEDKEQPLGDLLRSVSDAGETEQARDQ